MQVERRKAFNEQFSDEKYNDFVSQIDKQFPENLDFRIAESPIFVSKELGSKIFKACDSIIESILNPNFKAESERAIPIHQNVPNENEHSSFLAIDFALTKNENGEFEPQLIELQGFPSLFGFQYMLAKTFKANYQIPENYSPFFNGTNEETFISQMKAFLLNGFQPDEVIILEIFPEKQKTLIDFAISKEIFGIDAVCITKIKKVGKKLFREKNGNLIEIKRIYNRLIFDDLENFPDLKTEFNLVDDVEVEWCGHPNWFFRISKFTMPTLDSEFIPKSFFLDNFDLKSKDLSKFVLKPLFSFAGSGVKLNLEKEDLTSIQDKENFLIQEKITYNPAIQAINGLVKAEIRMLYIWPDKNKKPTLITNLARLSRGEMIGVRFNKDFDWVGGSICFFEN